jgi:hypothetical protein
MRTFNVVSMRSIVTHCYCRWEEKLSFEARQRHAFAILGPPAHGTLTAFDEKTGRVTYTPAKGWKGGDRFTFKAVDATGPSSNRGTVTITAK